MKLAKKIITLSIALLAVFSFAKFKKNKNLTSNVNLEKVDVIALLSQLESGCRPPNKVMFYVDTEIIKKHRGFSEISARIYITDRISGASNELSSTHILLPYYKDAVIVNHEKITNGNLITIQNGDKIIVDGKKAAYSFNELISFKTIYNSYLRSSNKLLHFKKV